MTTTYRSNAYSVFFMPEATYGVDPGIVTAATVDGTTEQVKYQPQYTNQHGTHDPLRAHIRLAAPPDGLPKRPMVPVEQVYPTNDYDPFHAKGLRGGQEFSLTMHVHGGVLDSGSALDTDRPVPPPWLALCASASGRVFGHLASPAIGGGNLVGTNATEVDAQVPIAATSFDIAAETGTIGTMDEGVVFGVDFGTGTSTPDIELCRCTFSGGAAEFGDNEGPTSGAVYNGTNMGFSAAPAAGDIVYWPCQVAFDRRFESVSPSYTILIMRPDVDTAYLMTGCKAKEFEISANFGEIPTCKITFVCKDSIPFSEGGTAAFGGTPTMVDEPDYYSSWPCAKVIADDEIVFMNNTTVSRGLAISGLSIKWSAGYTPRHSNMATEGTEDVRLTEKQDLTVSFTCLYRDEWRDLLGACYAVDGTYGTFPLIYWSGENRAQLWAFAAAALHLKEDPGLDGDFEGNQAHTVTLGCRRYSNDNGNFATTTLVDTKWALCTF